MHIIIVPSYKVKFQKIKKLKFLVSWIPNLFFFWYRHITIIIEKSCKQVCYDIDVNALINGQGWYDFIHLFVKNVISWL